MGPLPCSVSLMTYSHVGRYPRRPPTPTQFPHSLRLNRRRRNAAGFFFAHWFSPSPLPLSLKWRGHVGGLSPTSPPGRPRIPVLFGRPASLVRTARRIGRDRPANRGPIKQVNGLRTFGDVSQAGGLGRSAGIPKCRTDPARGNSSPGPGRIRKTHLCGRPRRARPRHGLEPSPPAVRSSQACP